MPLTGAQKQAAWRARQKANAAALAQLRVRYEQLQAYAAELQEQPSSSETATCSHCQRELKCPACYQADPWGA